MKEISYLSVAILLLSFFVIKEMVKAEFSPIFQCSYSKNVLLDSNLYTSYSLACPQFSYFSLSLLSFLSIFFIGILFNILEDKRIFSLTIFLAFVFLVLDVLEFYYAEINYSLFLILSILFFSILF